ncbi:hypothetical protein HZ994_05655 [Akkermansiaceae bacterium]|nr:hypothetical protein HZ994_05655 [Akkermansiaceae bacterium]
MIRQTAFLFLLTIAAAGISPAGQIALKLEAAVGGAEAFSEESGTWVIDGAMDVLATPERIAGEHHEVLGFEYFSVGTVPEFKLLAGPGFDEKSAVMLPPLGHSEGWTSYSARISTAGQPLPKGWRQLRLELPLKEGQSLRIRKPVIRAANPGEFDPPAANPAASADAAILRAYLDRDFPASISEVSVGTDLIRITGNAGAGSDGVFLADIPMDIVHGDARSWKMLVAIGCGDDGSFEVDLPRFSKRDGLDYDRLTSRWQLVRRDDAAITAISHARYAGKVNSRGDDLPPAKPANKKGLGGWGAGRIPGELKELGISSVTVNVMLSSLISPTPVAGSVPTEWQGRTYHMRVLPLTKLDATFREAAEQGAMVSAIILVANPAKSKDPTASMMGHPDAVKEGIFAMPNVTSPEGIGIYGAALNYIVGRWSRKDGRFGRVHHWIMQNEVDAGWVWTNAGEKSALSYMDLYQRSLRLMDLIARQYDPRSRPFITLTHHWAHGGNAKWYGSRRMLELLAEYSRTEGDFPWALAHHPYPENLRNPRAWEDKAPNFSFDTPKITPKNIEVLDAYMHTPTMLFQGKEVRPVHLSENGFNSPDYSAKSLEDQAAGMAMAWKKIQRLRSIEAWQYHNWIDNRSEGGLRIGLRKFPDEKGDPLGKKPIWHLYQALGTPREDEVAQPYLKTIGIASWDEVIHKGGIR